MPRATQSVAYALRGVAVCTAAGMLLPPPPHSLKSSVCEGHAERHHRKKDREKRVLYTRERGAFRAVLMLVLSSNMNNEDEG